MAFTPRQRGLTLAGALTATLAAVAWVEHRAVPEPVAATRPAKSLHTGDAPAAPGAHLDLEKLKRQRGDAPEIADLFETKSWYVPPPPPKPVPPPPPAPPPLPFKYLGKLVDNDKVTVFLVNQDRNYSVSQGDTLDGKYRVDSIDAQRVILTYLPLDMQQTLMMGGGN